jgi:hypothetical protein
MILKPKLKVYFETDKCKYTVLWEREEKKGKKKTW